MKGHLNQTRKEELLRLCRDMIRVRSLSGEEAGVSEILQDFFLAHRITDLTTDRYGNLIVRLPGSLPGKKVLFDGHMDTVPVQYPEKWTHDPFGAEIEDGILYGRGTADMKCALSAMAAALVYYYEDAKGQFPGELILAGIVQEEFFEGIASREVSKAVEPDYVIIGEASGLNLKIGQRGRAELVLETYGVPAHSSNPDKGVNAVYQICRVIEKIRALSAPEHPFLGKGILELTDIKSFPYPGASVLPEYARATYDRRLLPGESPESVLAPIQEILEDLSNQDPSFQGEISYARGEKTCFTGEMISGERFFPAWLKNQEDPDVQAVLKTLSQHGFHPAISKYSFCTNGSHYAGERGIPTLGMGPSREEIAHTIDEHCALEEIYQAAEIYCLMAEALLPL